jgi:hypothetical protein
MADASALRDEIGSSRIATDILKGMLPGREGILIFPARIRAHKL